MVYKISSADTDIEWGLEGNERIVQNVLNLLRTRQGEVPFMREMGLDPDFLDNNTDYVQTNIANEVVELIEEFEPRATVTNVYIENVTADSHFDIVVELEV